MTKEYSKTALNAHVWERDPDDYYIEEDWCNRRLFEVEKFDGYIFDSACGSGRILRAAQAAGHVTLSADKVRRGSHCELVDDFLDDKPADCFANIVCNIPFKICDAFARQALKVTRGKVALLVPTRWVSGDRRAAWLATTPLKAVWFLTPRPSMPPGALIEAGMKPEGGKIDFCWMVWEHGNTLPATFNQLRRGGGVAPA